MKSEKYNYIKFPTSNKDREWNEFIEKEQMKEFEEKIRYTKRLPGIHILLGKLGEEDEQRNIT